MRQLRGLITASCWVSSVSFSSIFFWSCCSRFCLFLCLSWHSLHFLKYTRISSFRAVCSLSSSSCCLELFSKSCNGKQKWQEELGRGTSPKGLGLREQNCSQAHPGLLPLKQPHSELTQKEPSDKKTKGAASLVVFKLSSS